MPFPCYARAIDYFFFFAPSLAISIACRHYSILSGLIYAFNDELIIFSDDCDGFLPRFSRQIFHSDLCHAVLTPLLLMICRAQALAAIPPQALTAWRFLLMHDFASAPDPA